MRNLSLMLIIVKKGCPVMKKKTIVVYLVFAFALAWIVWGILAMLGVSLTSPAGTVVVAITMFAPAAAVLIAKKTSGGVRVFEPSFKPKFKGHVRWYLCAWLIPIAFLILGGILYFVIFRSQFDPGLAAVRSTLESKSGTAVTDSALHNAIIIEIVVAITVNVITSMVLAFGEEIGWRGFLFPAVRGRTNAVKAYIICGAIWGLWHAPIIAMGHNFGFGYTGYPWLGILAMVPLCIGMGTFLSYVTGKTGSIWPAALGHGTINAVSGLPSLFLTKESLDLMNTDGSLGYGFITVIPLMVLAIVLIAASARKRKIND